MNNESKEDLKPVAYLKPFKRFCMTIGELPSAYVETMTYYEMLIWFIEYMKNTIIPTINNNSEAVNELQDKFVEFANTLSQEQTDFENAITEQQNTFETNMTELFNQLQTFVNNYFDNLDVQEEINNKLDDMVEDGTLQKIITQYIQSTVKWTFANVATMKTATNLIKGSYACTLGYYNIADGGAATYKIDDEYGKNDYYETLNNGLYAILVNTTNITSMMFGAKNDGTEDASTKLNTGILYVQNNSKDKIFNFTYGEYLFENPVYVPVGIDVNGHDSKINVGFNGYAFWLNTNGTNWVVGWHNAHNEFTNFRIYNKNKTTYTTAKGIQLGCAMRIKHIEFNGLAGAIIQTFNYIDNKYIEKCICKESIANDYDIIFQIGDGVFISQLMQFKIDIHNCCGADILNCINTSVKLSSCSAINIVGCHNERNAHFEIVASRCSFKDIFINRNSTNIENVTEAFTISSNDNITSCVTLENIEMRYLYNNIINSELNDISVDNKSSLICKNVYDYLCEASGTNGSPVGFKLNNTKRYESELTINRGVIQTNILSLADPSIAYNFPISAISKNTTYIGGFVVNDGTIYYRSRQLYDTTRLIFLPKTQENNRSLQITDNNQSINLSFANISTAPNIFFRLYRGSAQDSYNKVIDIPVGGFGQKIMVDNKLSINGCFFWEDRNEGNVDDGITTKHFEKIGDNVKIVASSIPTYGTWSKGDIIINSNPTANGSYGWICIEAGTPGTWKSITTIEA